MKFGNYILSEWETCEGGWNFWRFGDRKRSQFIGLIASSSDHFKNDLPKCYWMFALAASIDNSFKIVEVFNKIHGCSVISAKRYVYSELDDAKKEIDEFLSKYDKLKTLV